MKFFRLPLRKYVFEHFSLLFQSRKVLKYRHFACIIDYVYSICILPMWQIRKNKGGITMDNNYEPQLNAVDIPQENNLYDNPRNTKKEVS